MTNTDEARAAARSALQAYRSHATCGGNGDETDLIDLVTDLLHLADTFTGEDETSGSYVLDKARDFYDEELDTEVIDADDDEDEIDVDDYAAAYPPGEEPGGALPH